MFDIYLINCYWEDDNYTSTDLSLSLENVLRDKELAFSQGAAEVSIYAFQTDGNCLVRVGPIFHGTNPYTEETDELPEVDDRLETMRREKPLMTMEEILQMFGEEDNDEVS